MAIVPLPERGQPLDVTYIYALAESLNDLATQVTSTSSNYTSIDTSTGAGKQTLKTSESRIIGGYLTVVNNATVVASDEREFGYDFSPSFKYPPIVTVTPVNIGNTPAGQNVTVLLKTVTTSRVEGVVRFGASGDLSVAVNLIAIGVPN